jgi:hypothetical protein
MIIQARHRQPQSWGNVQFSEIEGAEGFRPNEPSQVLNFPDLTLGRLLLGGSLAPWSELKENWATG